MASPAPTIRLQELRAAMANAEELRALHAAIHNLPSLPKPLNSVPAEDYPVFTPSYGEPMVRYLPSRRSQSLPPSEISMKEASPSKTQPPQETHTHLSKSLVFSRLLPRFRRKPRSEIPSSSEIKPWVLCSVDSPMADLRAKLASLESHCDELRTALRTPTEKLQIFLSIAAEARLSVRQFCKLVISHAEQTLPSSSSTSSSSSSLEKLSRRSKSFLLRLEAVVNRVFYEDFENVIFERGGAPLSLDPVENQAESFNSFLAQRNGTAAADGGFRRRKKAALAAALGWSPAWAERVTRGFHVAADCVWMVHRLAFSFGPPVGIFRVNEGRGFDPVYMEDALPQKVKVNGQSKVNVMVAPGFYLGDRVLKCRVLVNDAGPSVPELCRF